MALLDLVGSQTTLKILGSNLHLVGKTRAPVSADVEIDVTPTTAFEECPSDLDVLSVPGGPRGLIAAMGDEPTLRFLSDRRGTSRASAPAG